MDFYTWQTYRCAYDTVQGQRSDKSVSSATPALLLIHPVGVGLSRQFWQPFIRRWVASTSQNSAIYNLDLLGCGNSDMPTKAYTPQDWANQIAYFIEQIAEVPVVLIVQGALLPVAVELMSTPAAQQVKGMVLSGPPTWPLMTTPTPDWKHQLAWSLFSSPLGNAFYRYARREDFLRSFSKRQLFERPEDVSEQWLTMLHTGSRNMDSRYAVFSFLAGFWRQDYAAAIARIQQPVMVVMGESASTIDRKAAKQSSQATGGSERLQKTTASKKRLQDYLDHFPRAQGAIISGRNVLPYESVEDFVVAIAPFISQLSTQTQ